MPDGEEIAEEMLRQLLAQDWEWGHHEDRSVLFLIVTMQDDDEEQDEDEDEEDTEEDAEDND